MASDEEAAKFRGVVECEPPNEFFDKFTGVVQLQPAGTAGARKFPLEANNVLLRGCVLRNVRHIYGIVVYTGRETKVWPPPAPARLVLRGLDCAVPPRVCLTPSLAGRRRSASSSRFAT